MRRSCCRCWRAGHTAGFYRRWLGLRPAPTPPPCAPRAGENKIKDAYNAIHVANTPCTDALKEVPGRWRTLRAHGTAVGLPSDDDMGNSEVRALLV